MSLNKNLISHASHGIHFLKNLFLSRSIDNGTFQESFKALVKSDDGITVYLTLEAQAGGDLTMQFSDKISVLDCTPIKTINLTVGTDNIMKVNYIYILQSTKELTVSLTGYPTEEHIKVAYTYIPSASRVQTYGAIINQNINDHLHNGNNMGHLPHLAEAIRVKGSTWFSGVNGDGTTGYLTITSASPDTIHFKSTSGFIYQLHKHTVESVDTSGTDVMFIANHPTDPFFITNDLASQLLDSTGVTMSGRYYSLVAGIVANKTGEFSPVMINLPSGSYNNEADALADVDGYNKISMPREFNIESSTGTFLAIITLKHSVSGGGTWTHINTKDIRNNASGSGSSTSSLTEFSDNQFKVFNSSDITKIIDLDLTGLTTATTRTFIIPDVDGTLITSANETDLPHLTDYSNPHQQDLDSLTDLSAMGTGDIITKDFLGNVVLIEGITPSENNYLGLGSMEFVPNWKEVQFASGWNTLNTPLGVSLNTNNHNQTMDFTSDNLSIIGDNVNKEIDISLDLTASLTWSGSHIHNGGFTINSGNYAYLKDGMQILTPGVGSFTRAFFIDIGGTPYGIDFYLDGTAQGWITCSVGNTHYHKFGVFGNVGNFTHTNGTNSINYNASFNVLSFNGGKGGVIHSNMTTVQRLAIVPLAVFNGLQVYDTTLNLNYIVENSAWRVV